MEGEGGASGGSGEGVVRLEDALELLVEHLVVPVLPRGHYNREEALSPENQEAVARQVHATVLLYNYYHRKQFPQLEFANPERFRLSASLTPTAKNLLMYLDQAGNGVGAGLSVTNKAIIDACDIAEALDATKDFPEMTMWPISKVAVLLLNRAEKKCLLQHGSQTKGVSSLFEKDIKTAFGGSLSSDMSVQGSSNKSIALPSGPYVLQQIAYSEVELKTGMKRTDLQFIEEHRVYSLSKKGTATMLFVQHYDQNVDVNQNVNVKLKEMPVEDVLKRMSGPIVKSDPYKTTTSVVECYHLLPYKEVLLNVLNRHWPLDSSVSTSKERVFQNGKSSSLSEIDESLKEQEANSNSRPKMKKIITDVSTPKKNKQGVKAVGESGTASKNRKDSNTSSKRKSEAFKATVATHSEHGNGQSPTKDLHASVQMDKIRTERNFESSNLHQIIPVKNSVRDADPVINDHALENQRDKVSEKSGGMTGNMNVQKYATLQVLRKMRDDTLCEHVMLGDRSAGYEMDIQTLLTETDMTPKVMSILKKHENSCWRMREVAYPICSGEGCQTMNIKRKKLKEAILVRNRCQELDDICRESNWILPRYIVLPSVAGDMYQASVYLTGPDFNLSADGDMKITTHEARNSAAINMLSQLQQKARED